MRSKRRWYPILIIGVVLLLASSIVGCPQPPVSTPPVIAEFSANPTNINSGESAPPYPGALQKLLRSP